MNTDAKAAPGFQLLRLACDEWLEGLPQLIICELV